MKTAPRKASAGKAAATHQLGPRLQQQWHRLHETDAEPFPDEKRVARLAGAHARFAAAVEQAGGPAGVALGVQQAWEDFHSGDFLQAIARGNELGALGASAANKATAVYSLYPKRGDASIVKLLQQATRRGETAVELLPDYANAHYNLALVMGRYSQRISILSALAAGLANRIRQHLERTLELEKQHAEAHIALGLYHAELISKLGSLPARLTYGASAENAVEHFRRAVKLAPHSPIALMEYAHGLLLLDARANRNQAGKLYAQAAALEPADAMERLDVARARCGIEAG
jgi:tetratricopeptide (TPR) repeat protein